MVLEGLGRRQGMTKVSLLGRWFDQDTLGHRPVRWLDRDWALWRAKVHGRNGCFGTIHQKMENLLKPGRILFRQLILIHFFQPATNNRKTCLCTLMYSTCTVCMYVCFHLPSNILTPYSAWSLGKITYMMLTMAGSDWVMLSTFIAELKSHKELWHVEYMPAEKRWGLGLCYSMPHQKPWSCTINVCKQPDKRAHYGTPQAKLRASGLLDYWPRINVCKLPS